jgi:HK97 family phage prohead protease
MKDKLEKRSLQDSGFEVRSSDDGKVVVEGYAAKFGDETVIGGRFAERIERSAFEKADMTNTVALFNHDWNMPLARVDRGLELEVDDVGLKYRFELGNQSYAKDLAENIRMGNVSTSSFGFTIADDTWEKRDDGVHLRVINSVEKLYDVSPTTQGAYPTTEVALRSMLEALGEEVEEDELRLLADEAAQRRAEEDMDSESTEEEEEDDVDGTDEDGGDERMMDEEGEEEEKKEDYKEEEERVDKLIDESILPHPFAQAKNVESTEARSHKSNTQDNMKNNAPAYVQGLGDSEARAAEKFSFGKMIKEAAQGRLTGIEAEMNQEARNEFQNAKVNIAGGISIPTMILRAAPMSVGADTTTAVEGFDRFSWDGTVGIQDAGLVEAFRPNDVTAQLGVRQLTNLTGDVVFNVQASELVADSAHPEAQGLTEDNINFTSVTLSPKRYGVYTRVTDQMLAQSADDMGLFIANDIRKAIDAKVSAAAITAINTAATLLEGASDANTILDAEAALLAADVPLENIAILAGTKAYRHSRELSLDPGSGLLYATSPRERRSIAGYPAIVHSSVAAEKVYMMDRSQAVTGTWGGLNIIIDPYTDADKGVVRMIANVYKDFATLQSAGFQGVDNVGE